MLHFVVSYGLLILACGYAAFKGGWPERATAIALLCGVAGTAMSYYLGRIAYTRPDVAMLAVDILFLAAMVWITLKADRYWTIPFTALQLIGLSGHVLRMGEAQIPALIYKILVAAPIYPMLLLLVLGTWRATARRGDRPQKSFRGFFPNMVLLMRRVSRGF